tara:strand:+ start:48433 stop:49200 length:768 start_codon:yes stop_codon:yes gene_type:complete
MDIFWAACSDPGLCRAQNEDSFCARQELGLYVVADGVGGNVGGDVASQLVVEVITREIQQGIVAGTFKAEPNISEVPKQINRKRLSSSVAAANKKIFDHTSSTPVLRGMATTVAAVLVEGLSMVVAHVGDSRVYLHRNGHLRRLTDDHSWVAEQMRAGVLSEKEAQDHPLRNVVTRVLSGENSVNVQVSDFDLLEGDRVLLCSDGLSSVLSDPIISTVLSEKKERQYLCDELVRRVNNSGGPDNVTIVIFDVYVS